MIFKKLFSYIMNFLREDYKIIAFLLIFYLVITFPLPYYVFTSGGITDLSNRFEVENGYVQKGSYNLSYVNQLNGNVLTYIISCIMPGMERVEIGNYQVNENESVEELAVRDKLMLQMANQNAVMIAYTKAGKEPKKSNLRLYVMATENTLDSDKDIKIGDILTKIEDVKIESVQDLLNAVEGAEVGTYLKVTFTRNDKEYDANIKVIDTDSDNVLPFPVYLYSFYDLELDPKIVFKFSSGESGSSAGLMTTLAIYDTLIEEDLTNGYKIAGTGTISSDGTVGEIGGVSYKLSGAVAGDADIFLVPSGENYEECIKLKKEKGYDIEIVEIKTFDDAIEYLENLKNKKE